VFNPDGGSAFPVTREIDVLHADGYKPTLIHEGGMSLRDYLASQCYIVTLVRSDHIDNECQPDHEDFDGGARDAYRRADAMLKARAK